MRTAYGRALVELGKVDPDVVVLSVDVSNSDHSFMFEDVFPDCFFNVGIADRFAETGSYFEMLVSVDDIATAAQQALAAKI